MRQRIGPADVRPCLLFGEIAHFAAGARQKDHAPGIPARHVAVAELLLRGDHAAREEFVKGLPQVFELRRGLVVILLRGHPLLEEFVLPFAAVEPKGFEHRGPVVAESLFTKVVQLLAGLGGGVDAPPAAHDLGQRVENPCLQRILPGPLLRGVHRPDGQLAAVFVIERRFRIQANFLKRPAQLAHRSPDPAALAVEPRQGTDRHGGQHHVEFRSPFHRFGVVGVLCVPWNLPPERLFLFEQRGDNLPGGLAILLVAVPDAATHGKAASVLLP